MQENNNSNEYIREATDEIGKNAGLIMIVISVAGLLTQLSGLSALAGGMRMQAIRSCLDSVHLSYFQLRLFEPYADGGRIVIFNIIFYVLSLTGAVLYIKSKHRESRLLRFSYSVVLLSASLMLLLRGVRSIAVFVSYRDIFFLHLLTLLFGVLFIFLSYRCLKHLNGARQLRSVDPFSTLPASESTYVTATRGQRFFNFAVDLLCCIFAFSVFTPISGNTNVTLYVMMYGCRFAYYAFFESVFGATPAKFLSETRVLNADGSKPSVKTIALRTLCRFVPFEPFSFFVVNDQYDMPVKGWHDKWTKTVIVREQQTGGKGSRYFWLIPSFIVAGLIVFAVSVWYEEHGSYLYNKHEHERKISETERGLNELSTRTIIKLSNADRIYSSTATYLRPVATESNGHLYAMFTVEDDYMYNPVTIGIRFDEGQEQMSKVNIPDSLLRKAYTKDYNRYRKNKRNTADLLGDGKRYEIESVVCMYRPIIRTGSASLNYESNEGSVSLGFENRGWETNLTEIKNLKGSVEWKNVLPQKIDGAAEKNDRPQFYIFGSYTRYNEKYEVQITLENGLGEKNVYRIKGRGIDRSLVEINP